MGSFDVMVRLARQAVDRERQALQKLNAAIADAERRIDDLAVMARSEADNGADFMTVGATLSAYLIANKQHAAAAGEQLRELHKAKAEQLERLMQQRVELKRYELMAERRAKRRAEEEAAKEQKIVDDLLASRLARARPAED